MTPTTPSSPADHPLIERIIAYLGIHAANDPKSASLLSDFLETIRHLAMKKADLEDRSGRLGMGQARSVYFTQTARNRDHAAGVLQMGQRRAEMEIEAGRADIGHCCNSLENMVQEARRLCPGITSADIEAFRLYKDTWINGLRADATIRLNFAAGLALGATGAQALQKAVDKAAGGDFAPAAITCYRLAAAAADGLNRENKKMKPDPDVVRDGELLVNFLVGLAKSAELGDINMLQARGPKAVEMVRTSALR